MTRAARFGAAIALACAGLVAGSAHAQAVPECCLHVPRYTLEVEGNTSRQTDNCSDGVCGNFTVTLRDPANNVVPGVRVWADFTACPDIALACDQLTAETGQTLTSPGVVSGYTGPAGQFTFKIQGHGVAAPPQGLETSPGTNAGVPCAVVGADLAAGPYENRAPLVVAVYDVNGSGSPTAAVNGTDVALVAAEANHVALGAQARARDDYNHSGTVSGADVALSARMALQAALGTGSQDTGAICP